jgi:hypothetical protein
MTPDPQDLPGAVETLEERIEALAEAAERSRKLMGGAKILAAAGCVGFLAMALGLVTTGPAGLVLSVAAALGGIVLTGSSRSTLDQTLELQRKAEALRQAAIDEIDPMPVREGRAPLSLVVDNTRDQR